MLTIPESVTEPTRQRIREYQCRNLPYAVFDELADDEIETLRDGGFFVMAMEDTQIVVWEPKLFRGEKVASQVYWSPLQDHA